MLTVEAEDDEQDAADDEWCDDVCVRPWVGAGCPVEGEEDERRAADEEDRANRITGPDVVFDAHPGEITVPRRPVENQEADGRCQVECCLRPEDVAPAAGAQMAVCSCAELADTRFILARLSEINMCRNNPIWTADRYRQSRLKSGRAVLLTFQQRRRPRKRSHLLQLGTSEEESRKGSTGRWQWWRA